MMIRLCPSIGTVLLLAGICASVRSDVVGCASPDEVFQSQRRAVLQRDWRRYFALDCEALQRRSMKNLLARLCVIALVRPGNQGAMQFLDRYGVDIRSARRVATSMTIVGENDREEQLTMNQLLFEMVDRIGGRRLDALVEGFSVVLEHDHQHEYLKILELSELRDLVVHGDTAHAKRVYLKDGAEYSERIGFIRIAGAWFHAPIED